MRALILLTLPVGLSFAPTARAQAPEPPPPPPGAVPTPAPATAAPAPTAAAPAAPAPTAAPGPAAVGPAPYPSAAPGAAAPPDPTARRHDGFYLRLGLGGGVVDAEFTGGQPDAADTTAKGGALLMDILVGGTPARGLVIGGGYHIAVSSDPEFEVGTNYTGSGGVLGQGVVGPFVDFFPDDEGGFDIGVLAGMAIVNLDTPKIFGQGVEIEHRGFGASGFAGYTLWLSDQWATGLTGRITWTTTSDSKDSDQTGSALAGGGMLTAIHH